ncbi:ribonuclease E/G [Rhodalgimonas zhirmunskyi]|uniref:Ribonuclease E/G n=1 Tax=Rhodalgimonas zhirmunskyi TaxID=2964767 RepID=A0AAJ1X758_9RHOB|nr:ribonuclease E/G [Rhodoalgimonas zhirmunskyi]MDQ2095914.1 ribonuclease E/G [Rhodoalgimonas zhirmunskyi]
MKGRQIILDHIAGREAAALMVDGRLDDLLIASEAPAPGTIYRAVARRPMKGQGGLFLETPDGNAYLRQVKGISPGTEMLVQVTGFAEPGKALPVTTKLLFKSRYAIVTPDAPGLNISRNIRDDDRRDALLVIAREEMGETEMGLILRSSCIEADDDEIADDIRAMAALAQQVLSDEGEGAETLTEGDGPHVLAWRDWVDPAQVSTDEGGFEAHGVLDALETLKSAHVPLSGGGSLFIEPTRALVAVDVNSGGDGSLAAGLKANLACARELPRQLRLRGLGGQIVIDAAPMPKKERRSFETALRAALRADGIDTVLAGWTPLGHYELQRKRARMPIEELLP